MKSNTLGTTLAVASIILGITDGSSNHHHQQQANENAGANLRWKLDQGEQSNNNNNNNKQYLTLQINNLLNDNNDNGVNAHYHQQQTYDEDVVTTEEHHNHNSMSADLKSILAKMIAEEEEEQTTDNTMIDTLQQELEDVTEHQQEEELYYDSKNFVLAPSADKTASGVKSASTSQATSNSSLCLANCPSPGLCQSSTDYTYKCAAGANYCTCGAPSATDGTQSCQCTGSTDYCSVQPSNSETTCFGSATHIFSYHGVSGGCSDAQNPCPTSTATCTDESNGGWTCACNDWLYVLDKSNDTAWYCGPEASAGSGAIGSGGGDGICGNYDNVCPPPNLCQNLGDSGYACADGPNYCACDMGDGEAHYCECTGSTSYCEMDCSSSTSSDSSGDEECTITGCIISPISGFMLGQMTDVGTSSCENPDNPCASDDTKSCINQANGGFRCECKNWLDLLNTTDATVWSCHATPEEVE